MPGFYKVWGKGDDVWVVGARGAILHRKGKGAFERVESPTKEAIFTIHGDGNHIVAVGGSGNGVILRGDGAAFRDASPKGAGLIQGVFATDNAAIGDWASGERGFVYHADKPGVGPFTMVDHGLQLPAASSLHSIYVDSNGSVWSAGGNVLTSALNNGMLIHFGADVPAVAIDDEPSVDAGAPPACSGDPLLPFKTSSIARGWDEEALAAIRRDVPRSIVHARNLYHLSAAMWDAWAGYDAKAKGLFTNEKHTSTDLDKARATAISYAAFAVLSQRYKSSPGATATEACLRFVMTGLGYDPKDTHDTGDDPIAFGNRIGKAVLGKTGSDGANEAKDYEDDSYTPVNPPLMFDSTAITLKEPEHWQPLNLSIAATSNDLPRPSGVQSFVGSQWGKVTPFALRRVTSNAENKPFYEPGPTPTLGAAMKKWVVDVIRKSATLEHAGDFWSDGPNHETLAGHWNIIANRALDVQDPPKKILGTIAITDRLALDVHLYLVLNGALHDAAIATYDIKRRENTARPISLIRWMGSKGQSSDPLGASFDRDGLPLVNGLIEIITPEEKDPRLAPFAGQIAIKGWLGEPADPKDESRADWIRAVEWTPRARRTVVTPPNPGFVSETSALSRAAAEVLSAITGSPKFPGGSDTLAPATLIDAADRAGESDVAKGLQIEPDDLAGRRVGHEVGKNAIDLAKKYFDGSASQKN